jgi:hypothetical protein
VLGAPAPRVPDAVIPAPPTMPAVPAVPAAPAIRPMQETQPSQQPSSSSRQRLIVIAPRSSSENGSRVPGARTQMPQAAQPPALIEIAPSSPLTTVPVAPVQVPADTQSAAPAAAATGSATGSATEGRESVTVQRDGAPAQATGEAMQSQGAAGADSAVSNQ